MLINVRDVFFYYKMHPGLIYLLAGVVIVCGLDVEAEWGRKEVQNQNCQ